MYAATLKHEKQKQKIHGNKNEEAERRQELNRIYQQQNEQPTPSNEQTLYGRYKNNKVQSYHREVTQNFQATSSHQYGGVRNDHVITELVPEMH